MATRNACNYSPTQYNVQVGGVNGTLSNVAPSATAGIPLVSGGSSANPSYTTAVVSGGGTGLTSTTAYGVICGGTTTTGNFQNAGAGSSGQVLTSNGISALPSFTNPLQYLISSQVASSSSDIRFTNLTSNSTYNLIITSVRPSATSNLTMEGSTDNGSTWVTTGYLSTEYYNNYNSATVNITTSTTNVNLSTSQTAASASHTGFFNIWFSLGSSTSRPMTGIMTYRTGTSTYNSGEVTAFLPSGFNAIRLVYTGGATIFSGKFSLYYMPNES